MENLETRLNEVARIAVRLEQQTGCPAQLLIAQWAIESKWGEKPVGHANYFGVKRAARHTQWCTVDNARGRERKSVIENLRVRRLRFARGFVPGLRLADYQGAPYHAAWAAVSGRPRSAHSDCGGRGYLRD